MNRLVQRGLISLVSVVAVAVAGCDDDDGPVGPDAGAGDMAAPMAVVDAGADAPTAQSLRVSLVARHAHIYKDVKVTFRIVDGAQCRQEMVDGGSAQVCPGVPGLKVVAFHEAAGVRTEQAIAPGVLVDLGDGNYEWTRMFTSLGANVVGLRFTAGGQAYYAAFPYDTSKAGGERYFCDTNGDRVEDHAFQVRWNTSGISVAANGKPTAFQIELMRSTNAPPLNTAEPFRNTFEHLRPTELQGGLPTVRLMSGTGPAAVPVETLTAKYIGRGIYTVEKAFAATELAGPKPPNYWLRISFTDEKNCAVDTVDEAEYRFPLTP
jgi:hypothetical protein